MKWNAILVITLMLGQPFNGYAEDWGPWEAPQQKSRGIPDQQTELTTAIKLFQRYISPIDGARCNMYPTCSAYALEAVRREHGPLLGSFIVVDRLYHEGDPIEQQNRIIKYGYYRYYDPLISNTFWLKGAVQSGSRAQ